jgi:hypothetical protein
MANIRISPLASSRAAQFNANTGEGRELGSSENFKDILRGFNASPKLGIVVVNGEIYEGAFEVVHDGTRHRTPVLDLRHGGRLECVGAESDLTAPQHPRIHAVTSVH